MSSARRRSSAFAALALLGILFPFAAAAPVAAADPPATVPSGFQDRLVWSGLSNPTAVAFTADGSMVFVAEKNGRIKEFNGLTDTSSTTVADLSPDVHNYWDRGLLGLAVDPKFTTGRPYLYALYAYNHVLGASGDVPHWGTGGLNDTCPDAAGRQSRRVRDLGPSRSPHGRSQRPVGVGHQAPHHRLVPAVPEPFDRVAGLRAGGGAVRLRRGRREFQRSRLRPARGLRPRRHGQPVRRSVERGRRAAFAGPADERRPDQPRWRGPADRPRYRRRLARQRELRQQRREQGADHRRGPPQPVPDHGPLGRVGLDRGRRVQRLGGDRPDPRPGCRAPELRMAVLRGQRRRSPSTRRTTCRSARASRRSTGRSSPTTTRARSSAGMPARMAARPSPGSRSTGRTGRTRAIGTACSSPTGRARASGTHRSAGAGRPTSGTSSCSPRSIRPTRPRAGPSTSGRRRPATSSTRT